jgi:hypothetical protein
MLVYQRVYLGWTNWFLRILRWITVRKIHSRKESVNPFKSRDGFSHEGCMQNARFKLQKWNPHVISWFWDSNSWSNRPCLFLHLYSGITGHHPKMGIFLVPTDPQNGSFWPGLSKRVPSTQCWSQNFSCEIFYLEGIPVYPIFRHTHVQHQVAYMILSHEISHWFPLDLHEIHRTIPRGRRSKNATPLYGAVPWRKHVFFRWPSKDIP